MTSQSKIGQKYSLTLLTCITACLAFVMLCISISTDNWLSTFERESDDNGTTVTAIHSGLWRQCKQSQYLPSVTKKTTWNVKMKTFPSNELVNCSYIRYFKGKQAGLAEIKPPEAILSDMQPAAFFPTTGLLGLLTGCILSFLSYCDQKVKKLIFVGGGLFVLSGIFMLVGIVLYVGSISQAFDSTAGNLDSEEKYVYDYGGSFYFTVLSFILTEFSGVFAIYLYIAKHRHYLRLKREKVIARSQSVNSCAGLMPSVSRFSFETPQEMMVNSADLSYYQKKSDLSTSTSVDWCDMSEQVHASQSQWLSSNGHPKSNDKIYRVPLKRNGKPALITSYDDLPTNGTMLYDDELGETSFGYYPGTDYNSTNERVFFDNTATTYYIDSQHGLQGRHPVLMSPDHGIMTVAMSVRGNQVEDSYSTTNNLRNVHPVSSMSDNSSLCNGKVGNNCNCAQLELANHLSTPNESGLLISPPLTVVLPQKLILPGQSSRKITSV